LKKSLYIIIFLFPQILLSQEIRFDRESGFYGTDFELEITSNYTGDIRYTLDGTDPDTNSLIYSTAISISNRNLEPNIISNIPTNPASTVNNYVWIPPQSSIPKARIVKAALFENKTQISDVFFEEYFVGWPLGEIKLPVFSIQADSIGLFGYEEGIYVAGKDYDNNPNIWQPGNYFERGVAWERVVTMSYYDNNHLALRQGAGMRIHGGASRLLPCKSFRLYAKKSLGEEFFNYPFFQDRSYDTYKRILFRNSGQDFHKSLFRDVLMQDVLKSLNVEFQSSLQVVVFINGSYWGIHNLRERYDKHYFKNFHKKDLDEIDYMETASEFITKEGNIDDYEFMNKAILTLDLSEDENFQFVVNQIDINNYIDYHISKVYSGVNDWIGNNERLWRTHEVGAKWRWVGNDYDDGFRGIEKDSYEQATREDWVGWPTPEWSTRLFRKLMTNNIFVEMYRSKLKFHLENTFNSEKINSKIDSLTNIYRPEMPRQIERWNYPSSMQAWETTIADMKLFAIHRPEYVWENFHAYFPVQYENPTDFLAYPNPANRECFIELPKGSGDLVNYSVYNTNGQNVMNGILTESIRNMLDCKSLQNGFYVLKIEGAERLFTTKLIISR